MFIVAAAAAAFAIIVPYRVIDSIRYRFTDPSIVVVINEINK